MKKGMTDFLNILLIVNILGFLFTFYPPKSTINFVDQSDLDKLDFTLFESF